MNNLRNEDNHNNSFWDWGALNGCFGAGKIRPMDFDKLLVAAEGISVVERRSHFLAIETKHPKDPMKSGQMITLEELGSLPRWTVLHLEGPKNYPQRMRTYDKQRHDWNPWIPANWETIRQFCRDWYLKANGISCVQ